MSKENAVNVIYLGSPLDPGTIGCGGRTGESEPVQQLAAVPPPVTGPHTHPPVATGNKPHPTPLHTRQLGRGRGAVKTYMYHTYMYHTYMYHTIVSVRKAAFLVCLYRRISINNLFPPRAHRQWSAGHVQVCDGCSLVVAHHTQHQARAGVANGNQTSRTSRYDHMTCT